MAAHVHPTDRIATIERENLIQFGLKWSLVGFLLALIFLLGACENMMPKEKPRFNKVVGERRPPALNMQVMQQLKQQQQQQTQTAAPVPMVSERPQPMRPPQQAAPMNRGMHAYQTQQQPTAGYQPATMPHAAPQAPVSPQPYAQMAAPAWPAEPRPAAVPTPQPQPVQQTTTSQPSRPISQAQPMPWNANDDAAQEQQHQEQAYNRADRNNSQMNQMPPRPQQPSRTSGSPSMIDQISGFFFGSDNEPVQPEQQAFLPPQQQESTYPDLPANIKPHQQSDVDRHSLDREIAELERELAMANHEQSSLQRNTAPAPVSSAENREPDLPSWDQPQADTLPWNTQQSGNMDARPFNAAESIASAPPSPQGDAVQPDMPSSRPQRYNQEAPAGAYAALEPLPAPPAPRAASGIARFNASPQEPKPLEMPVYDAGNTASDSYAAQPSGQTANLSQQPLSPTSPFSEADQINGWQQAPSAAATPPQVMQEPLEVPLSPPVYENAVSRLPSGLIPPDLSRDFQNGYLPPSRYQGRY